MNSFDIDACRALALKYISTKGNGELCEKLGDGGSAVVFRWRTATLNIALKIYDPKFFSSEVAPAERHRLQLQRRLIGKHCNSLIDTIAVDEELGTCFVQMEFFEGVELKKVIPRVPHDAVSQLIGKLVSAVVFLEELGLVHRDIKPENILVSADFKELRLLDLGVVREASATEDRTDGTDHGQKRPFIATAQYSSPEYLFRLEPPSTELWKALSLYQVGGVLHDLVCKRPLFERAVAADNKYALAMAVMREPPDFTGIHPDLSFWAALSARCLTKDGRIRLQLADWGNFTPPIESAQERLRRTLAGRAAKAAHGEVAAIRFQATERRRVSAVSRLVESLRNKLVAQYSPHLRITHHPGDEHRTQLVLTLDACDLNAVVAVECQWETGVREAFCAVSIAAIATKEVIASTFSGERRQVGELDENAGTDTPLLEILLEAVSLMLVKHSELVESGNSTSGLDLVGATWPA